MYWTIEKIEEALNRAELAETVELPIEQFRELLLKSRDIQKLAQASRQYKKKHGLNTYTHNEYIELFDNVLENY